MSEQLKFQEFKNLTEEEKQLWNFQQLSKIPIIDERLENLERRTNYIYAYATGVAAAVSIGWMFVRDRLIK